MLTSNSTMELREVGHAFVSGRPLFEPISHVFNPGVTVAITGASGSGKTTLLEILAGWLHPSSGAVQRPTPCVTQWVFQNPHGTAKRSVLDHVSLPILVRGRPRSEAEREARWLLEQFEIAPLASRTFSSLSGGEAQRLMFARAVAARPDLLLLDEPTAQLDMRAKQTVNQVVARFSGGDSIVVVATHDEGTRDTCDQVLELRRPRAHS